MSVLLVSLVEPWHCVVGYGEARVVEEAQAYVSIAYAFVLHPIVELEIEIYGVVSRRISRYVEGRNVKLLDGAVGLGGA